MRCRVASPSAASVKAREACGEAKVVAIEAWIGASHQIVYRSSVASRVPASFFAVEESSLFPDFCPKLQHGLQSPFVLVTFGQIFT